MRLEIVTRHRPGREKKLARCIQSVKGQTDHDFGQTILVDHEARGVEYANGMLASFTPSGDWVWILDDDDVCCSPDVVADTKRLAPGKRLIFCKMRYQKAVLPTKDTWEKPPVFGKIGMGNFIVRSDVYMWMRERFRVPVGADFKFISAVYAGLSRDEIVWHNKYFSQCYGPGRGGA